MKPYYQDDLVTVLHGDCIEVMRTLPDASVHAVITDPPYALGFMGREWDTFGDIGRGAQARVQRADEVTVAGQGHSTSAGPYLAAGVDSLRSAGLPFQQWCEEWSRECLRVLKPGGHLLAFGGTRTWHRLAVAVEDAGFEIRDSIAWLYGSGFPKSLDVSKAIDKMLGAEREITREAKAPADYDATISFDQRASTDRERRDNPVTAAAAAAAAGWGTALKPAFEPIVVGRKPFTGTVAANVLEHGTGALNIDATRIGMGDEYDPAKRQRQRSTVADSSSYGGIAGGLVGSDIPTYNPAGRWPTNVLMDESQADALDAQSGNVKGAVSNGRRGAQGVYEDGVGAAAQAPSYADQGGASRFFPIFRYEAKAPGTERPGVDGVQHPTVKPLDLMRWLVRLVTPPGGVVLEPFAGSGTTLEACLIEGFNVIGIEREADYLPLIMQRISKPLQQSLDLEGLGA